MARFAPKESSGYMNLAIDKSWGDSPWSTRALRSYSSLYCSVKEFLPLLGSCAVVRPPDAEKDKQSNKWGSGIYGAFLKEVLSLKLALSNVECRTCHGIKCFNEVRMGLHSIQECHQLLI